MSFRFNSRKLKTKLPMFAYVLATFVVMATISYVVAECPKTRKNTQDCPDPADATDCKGLTQANCPGSNPTHKWIVRVNGDWGSQSAGEDNTQAVDNRSVTCWVEWDCEWSTSLSKCVVNDNHVDHAKLDKRTDPC